MMILYFEGVGKMRQGGGSKQSKWTARRCVGLTASCFVRRSGGSANAHVNQISLNMFAQNKVWQ